jgi:hypothetical protein
MELIWTILKILFMCKIRVSYSDHCESNLLDS